MPLQTAQYSVGTAAVEIMSPKTNPVQIILHNANKSSNTFIWFGGSADVTTSTGSHLVNSDTYQLVLQPGNSLWAISDGSNRALHVITQVL
jgi:hypothetical protein